MGLGGVILASAGIIMVVLVANGRWDATWAAMLGNGGGGNTSPPPPDVQAPGTTVTIPVSQLQQNGQ